MSIIGDSTRTLAHQQGQKNNAVGVQVKVKMQGVQWRCAPVVAVSCREEEEEYKMNIKNIKSLKIFIRTPNATGRQIELL